MAVLTEHRIVADDGQSTVVDEYAPDGEAADADEALLLLPALGVPIAYYRPLFEGWADRGRRVFGLEVRGQPRSSTADVRRHDFGWATILERDLPAALAQTPLGDVRRLVAMGHSLGGQLCLLATGAGILAPERIVTIASGTSSWRAVSGGPARLARRLVTPAAMAVTGLLGYFPGHRLGFGGRQPRTMIGDWHREAWHGRYRFAGTEIDWEGALGHVAVPVLAVSFEGDPLTPHAGTDLLMGRVGPTVPERLRLTVAENGGAPYDHVRWARRSGDLVRDRVEAWLERAPYLPPDPADSPRVE